MTEVKAESSEEQTKILNVFGWASFLHDVGSDIVFSVWPIFVTEVLHAPVAVLGFVDGLGDAIVALSQAGSGWLSDKIHKRKIFVWLGYAFGGLARLGYAFTSAWGFLIPFRILDRVGKMRGSPRDAIVSEISNNSNRGRNFGFLRGMDNAGAVIGTLIAITLIGVFGHRTMFVFAALPSLAAALMIFKSTPEAVKKDARIYEGFHWREWSPNFWKFLIASVLFALSSFSYSFLLLFAYKAGFAAGAVPVLYLLFTIVAAGLSSPAGRAADRWGRRPVLIASTLFWVVSLILFATGNWFAIIAAFVCYGVHLGSFEPAQRALVAELAPPGHLASSLGAFQAIIGICALPASLAAGFLWSQYGPFVPIVLGVILAAVSGLALLAVSETFRPQERLLG